MERPKQQNMSSSLSSAPPPRTLNISDFAEARAPELQSLYSVISNRLNNNFKVKRNQRKRTTGFDNRSNKRKHSKKKQEDDIQVQLPRRVRRRIELRKNPDSGYSTSGDGTKRLRTHLWHSKRFAMAKKWGFYLPVGLPGRGTGSRALLKWFKHGAVLHDASYNAAVQLEGPEDSLLSILRMVLVPIPSVLSTSTLTGSTYGSAMLHHVGAPFSQPICPVTYMWRPFIRPNFDPDTGSDHNRSCSISPCSSLACSSVRQLWVWIHAGALSVGLGALNFACQKQRDDTGSCVNCFSLEGQLAKLEIMGSKAIQILQKVLHPVSGTSECSLELMTRSVGEAKTYPQLQKSFILEHAEHLPDHALLSLVVNDPRDLPKKGLKSVSEVASSSLEGDAIKKESNNQSELVACSDQIKKNMSSLWLYSDVQTNCVLYSDTDLWENSNGIHPPVEENILCMEKHQKRMDFFHLDKSSGISTTETKEQYSRSCPVILMKSNLRGSYVRCAIILPLSWVKAFWLPLVNHGAHVVGLRERHWIACDVGLPSFPFDFPDCKTYSCFMAAESVASDKKMELRPLAMRPSKVPIPPPWDSISLSFEIDTPSVKDIQDISKENSSSERNTCGSLCDASTGCCEPQTLEQDNSQFKGLIARTSSVLTSHLNEINGGDLLLYPNNGQTRKMTKLVTENRIGHGTEGNNHLPFDRKPCFLRVFLRAYKEGSFEEGSVVCIPHLNDILLWTSRSDVQEGKLQIPQSSIGSYYTLQDSGRWELQKPEDPATRESHRWPIGFVTTGFVRGSTKPTAVAFCEATLLAKLRREQLEWKKGNKRSEIFVLVRNLRSAAYKLSLATIVLEKESEDVEFM